MCRLMSGQKKSFLKVPTPIDCFNTDSARPRSTNSGAALCGKLCQRRLIITTEWWQWLVDFVMWEVEPLFAWFNVGLHRWLNIKIVWYSLAYFAYTCRVAWGFISKSFVTIRSTHWITSILNTNSFSVLISNRYIRKCGDGHLGLSYIFRWHSYVRFKIRKWETIENSTIFIFLRHFIYSATCTYRTLYKPESCLYRNNYLVPN